MPVSHEDLQADTLVREYGQKVYNIAYRITANHHDAEDITQETFIQVHRNLHTFRGESSPYTWIIGLGNDELGYIIPNYDFELDLLLPYINEADGDHYEETNSIGPHITAIVDEQGDALVDFIDWL